jgi:SAM-dependent methyltransferase
MPADRQNGQSVPPVGRQDLEQAYRRRFEHAVEYRRRTWALLARDFFQRYIEPDAAVLDLGCGWGEFLAGVQAGAKYGVDLNPESERRLPPDVTFLRQDCAESWPFPEATLDVVFTSNFLEHLRDKENVKAALAEARRCLRPGGRLICLGPNIRYLPGTYWDFWDHAIPLTDRSLAELLELLGFSVELRIPRFLPYSMSQGWNPPLFLLRWYLRLRWAWPLFGKQFLLIARRP